MTGQDIFYSYKETNYVNTELGVWTQLCQILKFHILCAVTCSVWKMDVCQDEIDVSFPGKNKEEYRLEKANLIFIQCLFYAQVALAVKEPAFQCRRHRFNPWIGKSPWRRAWQPIPVFLPGESHGQRSLTGYSP